MFGLHVSGGGSIPYCERYTNKWHGPHETFEVPRQLFQHHSLLSQKVPKCISELIINFAYLIGPRARLNRTIVCDYNFAGSFYHSVLNDPPIYHPTWAPELSINRHEVSIYGRRVDWIPLPYLHPLRNKAIHKLVDFDEIPWATNQVH